MILTPTQLRVMSEIATGATYKEVAQRLSMANQSVKNHAYDARKRLRAESNTQAFVYLGWLRVPAYSWTLSEYGDWILTDALP